jgi:hypothetical protein
MEREGRHMTAYLIHARDDQVVTTREFGVVSCFAYSHPAWYANKAVLGADFEKIRPGDSLIICNDGKLRSAVRVDEVVKATDVGIDSPYPGKPVRLLKGKIVKRLGDVSVEAAVRRASKNDISMPPIINTALTGFKQGAFCCALTKEQEADFTAWP